MSAKKTIELNFGKDKKPIITIEKQLPVPESSGKKYDFNKFVLEVSSSKDKKTVEPKEKPADDIPVKVPEKLGRAAQFVPDPVPSGAIPKPQRRNEMQDHRNVKQGPETMNRVQPRPQKKVEPPPVTEADLDVFRQFMTIDRVRPSAARMEGQILLGKSYVFTNQEEFVCSICYQFIVKRRGIVLRRCRHNFCSPCLVKHIKENHDDQLTVKCPFKVDPCESNLEDEEVKDLLGDDYMMIVLKVMQGLETVVRERERLEQIANGTILPDLVQVDDSRGYIQNFEVFECQICFVDAEIGEGVILKKCQHKFCKVCLIESVKHSEDFEVKCPNNDPIEGNCKEFFTEREIKNLVPKDVFDKHLEKSLKLFEGTHAQTTTHCKTPDCHYFLEHDKNLLGFKCIACSAVNCISCKAIHVGKNCRQYQDEVNPDGRRQREDEDSEKEIRQMVKNGDAMYCPRCGIPVMKNEGCDYIVCVTCKLGICWVTRKPRKPITLENGTVVDGCHCREGGDQYRCHPNCGFCH